MPAAIGAATLPLIMTEEALEFSVARRPHSCKEIDLLQVPFFGVLR